MAAWARCVSLLALAAAGAGDEVMCPGARPEVTCSGPRTPREYLNTVAHPSIYDNTARPPCGNSTHTGPTVVEVQLYLMQLNSVDPKVGTIVVNGYLRSWWKDPRLAYNGTNAGGCVDSISISGQHDTGIWTPDLYVDNLVEQTVTGMAALTQVYPDGSVWRSEQVLLMVKSKFDFARLPYEEHVAEIVTASYSQDITQMRIIPKGGTVGPGFSGVGVKAPPMSSAIWEFEEDDAGGIDGFQNPGEVKVRGGWDYLIMRWQYSRHPKYFITQVIIPCTLFLLISYIQFWVSAAAVPARAALAVIPVLIMRTMSNSIYASIPQGSQFMWLDAFVTIAMVLCIAAALHFGLVQAFRVIEAKRASKLAGLLKSKPVVEKLIGIARKQKVPVLTLLRKFAPVEKVFTAEAMNEMHQEHVAEAYGSDDEVDVEKGNKPIVIHEETKMTVQSEEAKKDGATEADLLFIIYTRDVFKRFDTDDSNVLSIAQVQASFTFFNVYMSMDQVVKVVAMFLRDSGSPSKLDEARNVLRFSQYVNLLMAVDKYSLKLSGSRGIVALFQGLPPSERCDVTAQAVFPVLMGLQFMVMYSLLARI